MNESEGITPTIFITGSETKENTVYYSFYVLLPTTALHIQEFYRTAQTPQ
jgi:hypothetical protein